MPKIRSLGYHRATKREVLLLSLDSVSMPAIGNRPEGRHFTCFCAIDAARVPADELGTFCSHLLQLGCAYLCAWGPDCERVHDIMDGQIVGDNPPETDLGCVMTTWHATDSLADALEFFLTCTIPDEEYAPQGCDWALILSAGSEGWEEAIEEYVKARTVPMLA